MFNNFMKKLKKPSSLSREDVCRLLKIHPEAMNTFEQEYEKTILAVGKDAVASREEIETTYSKEEVAYATELEDRIVKELKAKTRGYVYNGIYGLYIEDDEDDGDDGDITNYVTKEEINKLPKGLRPQLTGTMMALSCTNNSSSAVLWYYKKYLEAKNEKDKAFFYHHFRQGLDVLDYDKILYEIISTNKNSIGYWFPQLVEAVRRQSFFKLPKTRIIQVPMQILQMTRLDYLLLTQTTKNIINKYCHDVFELDDSKDYFVKTGTYSSKFDFRNTHVRGEKEVQELGEYLLFIHSDANNMASPLNTPSIYGMSTTTEWCVREFIYDKEHNPTIYKGLPLHTEYRVFVDFDDFEILGISPYWRPDVMLNRFLKGNDKDKPDMKHDYVIYKIHQDEMMAKYNANKNEILKQISRLMTTMTMHGQWSIDIMQNGDDFWIIDMALANTSALNDCVEKGKLKKVTEDWIPVLSEKDLKI